jgi:hypothetical protein
MIRIRRVDTGRVAFSLTAAPAGVGAIIDGEADATPLEALLYRGRLEPRAGRSLARRA